MITTLIFDLNKVLVTHEYVDLDSDYRKELGVSAKEFWDTGWKYYSEFNCGKTSLDQWFAKIFQDLGIDKSLIPVAIGLHARLIRPVKGMKEVLASLSGYRRILLAGDGKEFIRLKVYDLGFDRYFDKIYVTCREGIPKTDPEIYRRLLSRNSLAPEECLFIDDQKDFIEVAKEIGMNVILFRSAEDLIRELKGYGIDLQHLLISS